MMPPMFRSRSWWAISSTASRLHWVVVSSKRGTHELTGVHIDGCQCFRLIDDQIASALEPDFCARHLLISTSTP